MSTRASTSRPDGQAERPLTKAEQQRIQERHHVERVMREARTASLPKWVRVSHGRLTSIKLPPLPIIGGAVVVCLLVALSIAMVVQNAHLTKRVRVLQDESSKMTAQQKDSLTKVEQALQQLTTSESALQTKLQSISDGQAQLTSKLSSVEAGQATATAAWKEELASLEKATRDGLAGVATRLESQEALAASVREILPLLPKEEPEAPAKTEEPATPAPAAEEPAPAPAP